MTVLNGPGSKMEALYLKDCYLKEFDAIVESVKDGRYIVLSQTAFYPSSGGQPHDTGSIIKGDESFNIIYVGKFEGEISHEINKEGLKIGDKVKCTINWERRYKLMRHHTAAHILSEAMHRKTGALITGNQLDIGQSRIDFSLENFDKDIILGCINDSNEIVKKELPVKIYFLPREAAMKIENISKLMKGLPEDIKEVRVVEIEGYDVQADGGTHVKNTGEVGHLEFLKAENKGKNNRRVYFMLREGE